MGGHLRDLARDGPGFMAVIAREHDICRLRFLHKSASLVSHPDLIREVLVTRSAEFPKSARSLKFLQRPLRLGLVTNNGRFHRKQRRLLQPAFVPSRVNTYDTIVSEYTAKMLDNWRDGEIRDLSEEMTDVTMFIAARTLFNADVAEDARKVGRAIADIQRCVMKNYSRGFMFPNFVPIEVNRTMNRAIRDFDDVVMAIIDKRRKGEYQDQKDILSILLQPDEETGELMDMRQIRDEVATLFGAGHETTSHALTWTWCLLAQHPEIQEKLYEEVTRVLGDRIPTADDMEELRYVQMVFMEGMRIYPPVWVLNSRQPAQEVELGGYRIPAGELLFISPYAMHHQERYFPDPEKFNPERFAPENEKNIKRYTYIPFGAGPRVCIGNNFALMEGTLILAYIARRFRMELAPEAKVEMLHQVTLLPKYGMPMRLFRR